MALTHGMFTVVFRPQAIALAQQAGIFSPQAEEPADADAVESDCGCSADGVGSLLEVLSRRRLANPIGIPTSLLHCIGPAFSRRP